MKKSDTHEQIRQVYQDYVDHLEREHPTLYSKYQKDIHRYIDSMDKRQRIA